MRCEVKMTSTPSSRSSRTTAKSTSTCAWCNDAVASSRMRMRGSRAIALQTSTICCSPGESRRTGASSEGSPSKASLNRSTTFRARVTQVGDFVRSLLLRTPPNVTHFEKRARLPELLKLLRMGSELRSLDKEGLIAFHELMTKSAGDYLNRWFESDLVKALFGFDAVVGNYASPYTPGSAYVLLHHTIGGVNGRRGVWGHAIGGMGAITQAMAKAATAAGAEISIDSPVNEVV